MLRLRTTLAPELDTVTRAVKSLVALVGAVAGLSCGESPFEPRGLGERVPVGSVIEQAVTGDSARWYSFAARPNGLYAVFLDALQGTASLSVVDSAGHSWVAGVTARRSGAALEDNATDNFGAPAGAVYRLRVSTFPAAATARFRFMVYEINTAPEKVPARFAIGDTVTGETIDPIVDGDEFFAHGTAGEEVVLVMETLGPAGSGSVSLDVVDTAAHTFLGYVFGNAETPTLTTGRLRLPASRDYLFSVWGVKSNDYPRYRGPYRFWSYLINRAPEHRAAAIPAGTEIRGERIDRAGDVDEFTFAGSAGAEYNAFVQAPRAVQLEVAPVSGQVLATATSSAADTGLLSHATGRFQLATAGTYIVRVAGTAPWQIADTGAYRFFLYPIDRRPEHVRTVITPGDTISGEGIDVPGDVDEFTFSGTAGEEFNAFLQARSGSPDTYLQLDVVDSAGTRLGGVSSSGTDTSLLRQVTGRFALPTTGTYRLRVSGTVDRTDRDRGPYRVLLYKVNRRPETAPDTIALGDSVSRESIDMPGDVDEWRFTVRDSIGVNLVAQRGPDGPEGVLMAQLLDATGRTLASTYSFGPGFGVAGADQTGRLALAPGIYTVRVDGSSLLTGTYRLWLYAFKFGPESVRDTFAIGDTVAGESIDPLGDVDVFRFYATRGQHVNIAFQALGGPLAANLSSPVAPGEPGWRGTVASPGAASSLHDHQSMRVDLTETGWYALTVAEASSPKPDPNNRGPYRFTVERLGTSPERVRSALVPGDSVTDEAIDGPGDWDEYTLTALGGQDLNIVLQTPGSPGYPWLVAVDPATGDTLARVVGQSFEKASGPFKAPSSGDIRIVVAEPRGEFFGSCYDATCENAFRFVGPYRFRVVAVNRAPENVPSSFTLGDTVRGEAIFPAGDIDEFTSSGTPGDTLSAWWRLTANPVPAGSFMTLEVVDPATGATLAGQGASLVGSVPQYWSPGPFVVPPGGAYLLRVRGGGTFGDEVGTAPYEFFVKRGP